MARRFAPAGSVRDFDGGLDNVPVTRRVSPAEAIEIYETSGARGLTRARRAIGFSLNTKMKLIVTLTLPLISLSCLSASAEELKNAPTAFLGTNTDYAAIAMQCEGAAPYSKMTCSFTQTRIRKKNQATVEKERAELKANLEKMPEPELLKKFKPGPKELAEYEGQAVCTRGKPC